jgi:hypothetical protein
MATKLGEAFVEITARDVPLRQALARARADVEQASRTKVQFGSLADWRQTSQTIEALQKRAALLRAQLAAAVPGSSQAEALSRSLSGVNAQLAAQQAHLADIRARWTAVAMAAAAALGAMAMGLRSAAAAAMEAEEADMRLAAALATSRQGAVAWTDSLREAASQLQVQAAVDDEAVKSGMALLLEYGAQASQLEDLSKAAIVYARITGVDLPTAYKAVGMGVAGYGRQLKALIPGLKDAGDAHSRVNAIIEWGARNWSLASSYARTAKGAYDSVSLAWQDLREQLGKSLLPAIRLGAEMLRALAQWAQGLNPALLAAATAAGVLATALLTLVGLVIALRKAYLALAKAEILQQLAANWKAAALVGGAIVGAYFLLLDKLRDVFGDIQDETKKWQQQLDELNKAVGSLSTETPDQSATEDMLKSQREAMEAAKRAMDETKQAQETAASSWARAVAQKLEQNRRLRESEEETQKAAIGWRQVADIWKEAMVAGAQFRFTAAKPARIELADYAVPAITGPAGQALELWSRFTEQAWYPYSQREVAQAILDVERESHDRLAAIEAQLALIYRHALDRAALGETD